MDIRIALRVGFMAILPHPPALSPSGEGELKSAYKAEIFAQNSKIKPYPVVYSSMLRRGVLSAWI